MAPSRVVKRTPIVQLVIAWIIAHRQFASFMSRSATDAGPIVKFIPRFEWKVIDDRNVERLIVVRLSPPITEFVLVHPEVCVDPIVIVFEHDTVSPSHGISHGFHAHYHLDRAVHYDADKG